ncbi:probable protein phosphatase 2C 55 [Prosopis cineraria]|uniref:probable protein phosphatase 2C 55 n=1 Tax=Prosopis cineraria TaxID=364024 RepID=UPI00240EB418|nr:probable protein phosphatase 2C 55 [Prosopis cineraria]XP_054797887.1 probable protein phosphatase 2C 55 [Prosopis cineraria]
MLSAKFSRLRNAIQRSIVGRESGNQDSFGVLIGQGKLWLGGSSRSFHFVSSSLADFGAILRPGVALATSSEIADKRRTLSLVGTLSRTFSIPSLLGPSFQACGYHSDCAFRESAQFSDSRNCKLELMAIPLARAVVGECYFDNLKSKSSHQSLSSRNDSNLWLGTGLEDGRKVSMRLKNHKQPDSRGIYGYFIYNVTKTWQSYNPCADSGSREFHSASSTCFSAGPAPDVPFDSSVREEQLTNSVDSSDQKSLSGKTLKLISGSCYLPHPDKEETGGEDAHFICSEEQAVGVADGVGGWADLGIDAGEYSRELMSNAVNAIKEEPEGSIDPARVLEKAHLSTKAKGSSTACIIALTEQGLHAINLGDSGFMVVRDGCTIFRSPIQQHGFNFTYQLESGTNGDLPSSGQVFSIPVAPGDVIIAGTDGLFDNLYNNEITAVVVHAIRACLSPQVTAQKIAALARQRAQDRDRQTPFSTAAQDAGVRYYGGKLDDTTVVVSYIASSQSQDP